MKKIFAILVLALVLIGLSSAKHPTNNPYEMGWNQAPATWDQGYYQPQYSQSMGWWSYPNGSYWGIEYNSANYYQGLAPYQQYLPGVGWTNGYTRPDSSPPRMY